MGYLDNQTLNICISFGCSSKELEKLLNAITFQNRILNTERVRFKSSKNEPQTLLKK